MRITKTLDTDKKIVVAILLSESRKALTLSVSKPGRTKCGVRGGRGE